MCHKRLKNELIHWGNSGILTGSADAILTNILSFPSNVAALSSSYFVMDDDTTNYFEKEHFEFCSVTHFYKLYIIESAIFGLRTE